MDTIRLNNGQVLKAGDTISVTMKNFKGYEWDYHVDRIDLQKHEEYDRVKLSVIKEIAPNEYTKRYSTGERTITVEPAWFTANPNRTIKIIDEQRLNL